jgi:hypothetical protein
MIRWQCRCCGYRKWLVVTIRRVEGPAPRLRRVSSTSDLLDFYTPHQVHTTWCRPEPPSPAIFRAHTNMDMDLDPPFQRHRRKQNAGVELSNDIWLVVLDLVSMKSKLVSDAN